MHRYLPDSHWDHRNTFLFIFSAVAHYVMEHSWNRPFSKISRVGGTYFRNPPGELFPGLGFGISVPMSLLFFFFVANLKKFEKKSPYFKKIKRGIATLLYKVQAGSQKDIRMLKNSVSYSLM